jgi:3-deoxy-D-arabino-heptulosonate 7-phosphate (DAHP) synthase
LFETLTTKRLHQRECAAADGDIDVSDRGLDDIAERTVAELLTCDVCGVRNDGAESIQHDETEAGLGVQVGFECSYCGARNDNEAILS